MPSILIIAIIFIAGSVWLFLSGKKTDSSKTKGSSSKVLRIFIGLGAYLLCSGPFGGWTFLGITVICTFGVTLILWLPAFWLIGAFVLALFDPSTYDFTVTVDQKQAEKPSNKSMMAFISYIQKERAAGVSDQQISLSSKDAGWLDSDIQFALKSADSVK